jgi:hypothetical protein
MAKRRTKALKNSAVLSLFDYSELRNTSGENQTPTTEVTERGIGLEKLLKSYVFWGVIPCSLVQNCQHFEETHRCDVYGSPERGITFQQAPSYSYPYAKSLALTFLLGSGFQCFRRIYKVTKGDYYLRPACLSVHPTVLSVWNNWSPIGRIFVNFLIEELY